MAGESTERRLQARRDERRALFPFLLEHLRRRGGSVPRREFSALVRRGQSVVGGDRGASGYLNDLVREGLVEEVRGRVELR